LSAREINFLIVPIRGGFKPVFYGKERLFLRICITRQSLVTSNEGEALNPFFMVKRGSSGSALPGRAW
jgi:hypothetical protein